MFFFAHPVVKCGYLRYCSLLVRSDLLSLSSTRHFHWQNCYSPMDHWMHQWPHHDHSHWGHISTYSFIFLMWTWTEAKLYLHDCRKTASELSYLTGTYSSIDMYRRSCTFFYSTLVVYHAILYKLLVMPLVDSICILNLVGHSRSQVISGHNHTSPDLVYVIGEEKLRGRGRQSYDFTSSRPCLGSVWFCKAVTTQNEHIKAVDVSKEYKVLMTTVKRESSCNLGGNHKLQQA